MTVTIVGKNIQLTQALKNIIYEKVEKLEKKHFHGRTNYSIKVILKVENKNSMELDECSLWEEDGIKPLLSTEC